MADNVYMRFLVDGSDYDGRLGADEFRWWGGAYIERGYVDMDGEWLGQDVINVWDYEKDAPSIPVTLDAFTERVTECLRKEATEQESEEAEIRAIIDAGEPSRDDDGNPIEVIATCGACGRSWDDGRSSSITPAPSARCPFEVLHETDES